MERASLPLQKFFQNNTENPPLIGTERAHRLEVAKSLPPPLYTLFVQLQSHLDASPEEGVSVDVSKKPVSFPSNETEQWFRPDSNVVQLYLTLPENEKKNKQVTVEFVYLPKLKAVTAQASGCSDKVDLASLLLNLFPGDEGNVVWSADSVHLKDVAPFSMQGRPYHWCNYLAGNHMPSVGQLDPISTKAIVKELLRRLDANATLTNILVALKKKPTSIPVHPEWTDPSASPVPPTTKLVGWTEECATANKSYIKTFAATLKCKMSKLKASVTIDMSQYPSAPPKWSLTTGGESWGEQHGSVASLEQGMNPLYDNKLGQMERIINNRLDDLVKKDVEETYNWILAHQLHRLIRLWDDSQRAAENGESAGQVPRSVKGKDRATAES